MPQWTQQLSRDFPGLVAMSKPHLISHKDWGAGGREQGGLESATNFLSALVMSLCPYSMCHCFADGIIPSACHHGVLTTRQRGLISTLGRACYSEPC